MPLHSIRLIAFRLKGRISNHMPDVEIKFKLTLRLSEKWAGTMSTEELINYIKDKLNKSLGLRGRIKKLNVVNE